MKAVILIVIASVHFTGSYFDQSRLSSALMQFEGTLVFPREKQVDESAPGPGLSTVLGTVTPATAPAAAPGLSTVLGSVTPATSPAPTPGLSTSLETSTPTTEVEVEQTEVKDGVDGTELKVTVVDRETIVTSESSASTSPRSVSTKASSVVITTERSTSIGPKSPRSVSTKANSVVITTKSSASTSYSSPGSTTTTTSSKSSRSVSTKASPVVITTQSPASTSYSSPGSTTTMTSALTTRMLPVKSGAVWSTKDMMMTLHLGTGLWLLILSGGAMYVGGTLSLLWVRLGALQDQRARFAPPAPSVNV